MRALSWVFRLLGRKGEFERLLIELIGRTRAREVVDQIKKLGRIGSGFVGYRVRSPRDAVVSQWLVEEGVRVKKGDPQKWRSQLWSRPTLTPNMRRYGC